MSDRIREREDDRLPIFTDGPAPMPFVSRKHGHHSMATASSALQRPPILGSPPTLQPSGFIFPTNSTTPLFHQAPPSNANSFSHGNLATHQPPHMYPHFSSLKPRPEFPIFTGKDAYGWVFRIEQLLDYYEVPHDQRMRNAAFYLDEEPLQWFKWWVKARGSTPSWSEFKSALIHQFGTTIVINYKGSLTKLVQTGTFADYQSKFMRLPHHVDGLADDFLVSCFISGLKEELRYDVMMKGPESVAAAM